MLKYSHTNKKGGHKMKIGYVRVSTQEQNTIRQELLMQELGVEKIYIDKASGKDTARPQLQEMMNFVREGDTVIVSEISRFARNTKDLLELVDDLNKKNVVFESQKEKIDTSTPTGQFMLTIFGAVAQLERDYIRQRQREGIDARSKQGLIMGRPRVTYDEEAWKECYTMWKNGDITGAEFMKRVDIKPNTFYRRVKEYEKTLQEDAFADKIDSK